MYNIVWLVIFELCCFHTGLHATWSLVASFYKGCMFFCDESPAVLLEWAQSRVVSLQSWIEFNSLWSAAVRKAARLLIYRQDAACHLVILAQVYKCHYQSSEWQTSLKAALNGLSDYCINLVIVKFVLILKFATLDPILRKNVTSLCWRWRHTP